MIPGSRAERYGDRQPSAPVTGSGERNAVTGGQEADMANLEDDE